MRTPGRLRDLADGLRERLARLEREVTVLAVAFRDDRCPWYARATIGLTLGLAASPVDPIPDVVPVLGLLDDAVFVPLGVALAVRLTPEGVVADARSRPGEGTAAPWTRWLVAALVVLAWAAVALAAGRVLAARL